MCHGWSLQSTHSAFHLDMCTICPQCRRIYSWHPVTQPKGHCSNAFCAQGHTPLVDLWFQPWLWWKWHGSQDLPCAGSFPSIAMGLWRTCQPWSGRGVSSLWGSPQLIMEGAQWINAHIYFNSCVTKIFEKIMFSLLVADKGRELLKVFQELEISRTVAQKPVAIELMSFWNSGKVVYLPGSVTFGFSCSYCSLP